MKVKANVVQLGRKLLRKPPSFPPAPSVEHAVYREEGNQWYHPALAGPSTFLPATTGPDAVRRVLAVFERLKHDQYMDFVEHFYRHGLEAFGDDWVYADINTVLLGLARVLRVSSYLEIGVRQGRSLAMVASQQPGCYIAGFDMWMENYGGMENPGPDFVRAEMQRLGHQGQLDFISGDSHRTVPQYFKDNPARFFDLITVDGDHSEPGAIADLVTVMPRVKVGGALVFDDVSHQSFPYLRDVWTSTVASQPRFASYIFDETGFGIAFAIRKY